VDGEGADRSGDGSGRERGASAASGATSGAPAASGASGPTPSEEVEPPLEVILEEIEAAVEPVTESVTMSPAVGIAVAGGPMIPLPAEPAPAGTAAAGGGESMRAGLTQAGPVAVAGMVVNGVAALLVVAVARLVSSRSYGEIAQLLGLFFILSMPGSAVLVGVVRRVTALETSGQGARVRGWMKRAYRVVLAALCLEIVVVVLTRGWIARQLSLTNSRGVALILVAGGIWILLSVDRGLLQAHRRYRSLAGNLLVEGGARTALVLVFVLAHLGVEGYGLGLFFGELIAAVHAHWLNAGDRAVRPVVADTGRAVVSERLLARRRLIADLGAAFCGLALLGFLQNVDVILLGRLDHANVGPYAAISVASKAMVFGALALGAYLLPEATIRWNEGGHAVRQFGVTLIFLAVPALVLLAVSVVAPRKFLTIVFGARLSAGAPAFATLVAAMICLSVSVLITNYLFGTGSRWIVALLAAGSGAAAVLVARADGRIVATARADLIVQVALVVALGVAFVIVHVRHRGEQWLPRRVRPGANPSRSSRAPAPSTGTIPGTAG
jgi:O-antigen/teichoic acid export membrane protein